MKHHVFQSICRLYFSVPCQDMEGAMSATEVSNALGLSALKSRTWSIFKTSAVKGEGLDEAMEW